MGLDPQPRGDVRRPPGSHRTNEPTTFLNDTWVYQNENWSQIESAANPPVRQFGGHGLRPRAATRSCSTAATSSKPDDDTFEALFDTWEFDGLQWTSGSVRATNPKVAKPILGYDAARNETIMVGLNETGTATVMYRYDARQSRWTAVTPVKMPTCVNDGHMVYRRSIAAACCSSAASALRTRRSSKKRGSGTTPATPGPRSPSVASAAASAQAVAFDPLRREVVMFGGTAAFGNVLFSQTVVLQPDDALAGGRHQPPSPAAFPDRVRHSTPPATPSGCSAVSTRPAQFYHTDLWGYRNGQWFPASPGPDRRLRKPLTAFDSDRNRLVVICTGTETFEWDGSAWKSFTDLKKKPQIRRFAGDGVRPEAEEDRAVRRLQQQQLPQRHLDVERHRVDRSEDVQGQTSAEPRPDVHVVRPAAAEDHPLRRHRPRQRQ